MDQKPFTLTAREREVFEALADALDLDNVAPGDVRPKVARSIRAFVASQTIETSASPPRVPVSSARIRWVGVESGPGQPMTDAIWLVYSREHNAFWRPDQRGYTYDIAAAGRYTEADALECCQDRDPQPGKCPSEIAVVAPEAAAEIRRLRSDIAAMNDFVDRTLDGLSTARADGEARHRAGIEAAAKWHDDHAQRCESFGPDDIAAKMLGEDHREAAAAIRTLADAPANRGLDTTVALREIATIIERVDNRRAAADGPVSSTLQEMRQDEISRIYALATGAAAPKSEGD